MIPIIAIDGPSASGKGTVASEVARRLHYEYLDSGAWYRAIAWYLNQYDFNLTDEQCLSQKLALCHIQQIHNHIHVNQENITDIIRSEHVGSLASKWAVMPQVRAFLTLKFRACIRGAGLVADGRDMGSVVFPEAVLKIYLTATPQERARRRVNQLNTMGKSVKMTDVLQDILARDQRDLTRIHAPLHSTGYQVIDSTGVEAEEVVKKIMVWLASTNPS